MQFVQLLPTVISTRNFVAILYKDRKRIVKVDIRSQPILRISNLFVIQIYQTPALISIL